MYFNPCDEFPHSVTIQSKQRVPDGSGGFKTDWTTLEVINAFIDTPTSKERLIAQQAQNPLDRFMYYPYRKDIKSTMRILFDDDIYELVGRPEDQGGQNEIMRVALKLVSANA